MITLRSTFVLGVAALTAAGLFGSRPATAVTARPHRSSLTVVESDAATPPTTGATDVAAAIGDCDATRNPAGLSAYSPTGQNAAVPGVTAAPTASGGTAVSLTVLPRPSATASTAPASTAGLLAMLDCAMDELVAPVALG